MGLFDFWKKKELDEEIEYFKPENIEVEEVEIDIPEVQYVVDNRSKNLPTILLMDDFKGMTDLIKNEFERVCNHDIYKEFNIVVATTDYAGFSVEKALEDGMKVDIALLDITLGGVINGIEYDGVDVAIMIKDRFPDSLIKFVTGHTLNRKNPEIFQFIKKFEDHFKTAIDETYEIKSSNGFEHVYKHIIQKNSDRVFLLEHTIDVWMKQKV